MCNKSRAYKTKLSLALRAVCKIPYSVSPQNVCVWCLFSRTKKERKIPHIGLALDILSDKPFRLLSYPLIVQFVDSRPITTFMISSSAAVFFIFFYIRAHSISLIISLCSLVSHRDKKKEKREGEKEPQIDCESMYIIGEEEERRRIACHEIWTCHGSKKKKTEQTNATSNFSNRIKVAFGTLLNNSCLPS